MDEATRSAIQSVANGFADIGTASGTSAQRVRYILQSKGEVTVDARNMNPAAREALETMCEAFAEISAICEGVFEKADKFDEGDVPPPPEA